MKHNSHASAAGLLLPYFVHAWLRRHTNNGIFVAEYVDGILPAALITAAIRIGPAGVAASYRRGMLSDFSISGFSTGAFGFAHLLVGLLQRIFVFESSKCRDGFNRVL